MWDLCETELPVPAHGLISSLFLSIRSQNLATFAEIRMRDGRMQSSVKDEKQLITMIHLNRQASYLPESLKPNDQMPTKYTLLNP